MSLSHGWVGGLLIYGGLREKPLKIMTKKCGFPCLPLAAGSRWTPQDFDEEMWVPCLPLAMLGHGGKDKRGPSRLCRRIGEMVVAGNVGPGPPKVPLKIMPKNLGLEQPLLIVPKNWGMAVAGNVGPGPPQASRRCIVCMCLMFIGTHYPLW